MNGNHLVSLVGKRYRFIVREPTLDRRPSQLTDLNEKGSFQYNARVRRNIDKNQTLVIIHSLINFKVIHNSEKNLQN